MRSLDDGVQGISVGVGAASAGAASVLMIKFGVSQEAILSLLGALIGAASTVAGAAWLSDRNIRIEQRQEVEMLIEEYENINKKAKLAMKVSGEQDHELNKEFKSALYDILSSTWECRTMTSEALDTSKRLTFRHRARLREVLIAVTDFWEFHKKTEFAPLIERNGTTIYPAAFVFPILMSTDLALRQLRDPHSRLLARVPSPNTRL